MIEGSVWIPDEFVRLRIAITADQRIAGTQLVIEPRANSGAAIGREGESAEPCGVEVRIQNEGIDDCVVINLTALQVDEERRSLTYRSADIAAKLFLIVRGLGGRERIARIERVITVLEKGAAAVFVS